MITVYACKKGWRSGMICAALLACVLLPFLPACRHLIEGVESARCVDNLKQIGLAIRTYEEKYGSLPPACLVDQAGVPLLSWRVLILPYLDRDDLYRQIKLDEPWNSPHNLPFAHLMPAVYKCPADAAAKEGETSYVVVTGPKTLWTAAKGRRLSATNLSTTILVIESAGSGISWMEPRDVLFSEAIRGVNSGAKPGIVGYHPCGDEEAPIRIEGVYVVGNPGAECRLSGANCAFADASVYTLSENASPKTIGELLKAKK